MPGQIVLDLCPTDQHHRHSEGSFITLKNGDILFAWTRFHQDAHDDGRSDIVSRVSHDGGHTWEEEVRELVLAGEAQNVMSVTFLRLQDWRILFAYLRKDVGPDGAIRCLPYVCYSSDEMESWTTPIRVAPGQDYYVLNNDRVIQMKDGRLVMPVAQHRNRANPPDEGLSPGPIRFSEAGLITFFVSDDGENWFESVNSLYLYSPNKYGLQEPGVVELRDGRLWSWMRTAHKIEGEATSRQWQSFSQDRGKTWTEAAPSEFLSPCSPLSMKRLPNGELLAVWNDLVGRFGPIEPQRGSHGRTPLVMAISTDEGQSWTRHQLLESDPASGYCYTAIHFTDDALLLAYCAGSLQYRGLLSRTVVRRVELGEL